MTWGFLMFYKLGRASVSFPVTIEHCAETGKIHLIRRTHPEEVTEISHDPNASDGHPELYFSLMQLLIDAGAGTRPGASIHVN